MPVANRQLLDEAVRRLVAEFNPERIVLFGSHAWGQPDTDSDLDLLVIVSESDESPIERARRARRCLRSLGVPLDVLVKTVEEYEYFRPVVASLEHRIAEQGEVLYG
ncbi:MAG: nucleotidyltransferase domain-containing protein [Phycisphaerae bacterium]